MDAHLPTPWHLSLLNPQTIEPPTAWAADSFHSAITKVLVYFTIGMTGTRLQGRRDREAKRTIFSKFSKIGKKAHECELDR